MKQGMSNAQLNAFLETLAKLVESKALSVTEAAEIIRERIRQIRKSNGLTMEEFGTQIGIKKSSVSLIEAGKTNPSEQTLLLICDKFNINRTWLETGEGEMFRHQETDELLPALQNILADCPAIAKALKRVMEVMTKQDFARLNEIVGQCMNENERP